MKRYTLRSGTVVNLPSQGTDISRPPTEPHAYATESPTGNWVGFADYAALLEAAKLLAEELDAMKEFVRMPYRPCNPNHPMREHMRRLADVQIRVAKHPIAIALREGREIP